MMNAGAHGHEMREVLERVDVFDLSARVVRGIDAQSAGFSYRSSSSPRIRSWWRR